MFGIVLFTTMNSFLLEENLQVPADVLVSEGINKIDALLADHKPGETYILPRNVFSRFYREELPDIGTPDVNHSSKEELWKAIAGHEACRSFQENWEYCPSRLSMDANNGVYAPLGLMQWEYCTTSGTKLCALDWRLVLFEDDSVMTVSKSELFETFHPLIEWNTSSTHDWVELWADGLYAVTIPKERDQPGRTAWLQIRLAVSGLPYRCWSDEFHEVDSEAIARAELRKILSAAS